MLTCPVRFLATRRRWCSCTAPLHSCAGEDGYWHAGTCRLGRTLGPAAERRGARNCGPAPPAARARHPVAQTSCIVNPLGSARQRRFRSRSLWRRGGNMMIAYSWGRKTDGGLGFPTAGGCTGPGHIQDGPVHTIMIGSLPWPCMATAQCGALLA